MLIRNSRFTDSLWMSAPQQSKPVGRLSVCTHWVKVAGRDVRKLRVAYRTAKSCLKCLVMAHETSSCLDSTSSKSRPVRVTRCITDWPFLFVDATAWGDCSYLAGHLTNDRGGGPASQLIHTGGMTRLAEMMAYIFLLSGCVETEGYFVSHS